eukprot:scaffold341001_cov38-Prasinocladus_malaysianus.AAC.1
MMRLTLLAVLVLLHMTWYVAATPHLRCTRIRKSERPQQCTHTRFRTNILLYRTSSSGRAADSDYDYEYGLQTMEEDAPTVPADHTVPYQLPTYSNNGRSATTAKENMSPYSYHD